MKNTPLIIIIASVCIILLGIIIFFSSNSKQRIAYNQLQQSCETLIQGPARLLADDLGDQSKPLCDCVCKHIAEDWAERYKKKELKEMSSLKKLRYAYKSYKNIYVREKVTSCFIKSLGVDEELAEELAGVIEFIPF